MAKVSAQMGLADGLLQGRLGRNEQLEKINGLMDWTVIEAALTPLRSGERGPPPYPALPMLKALLLQQWYQLSDPGLEAALADRLSFRRFLGLGLDDATPDHSTLWRFRTALRVAELDAVIFAALEQQLLAAGLIIKRGTLIDATLVQARGVPAPNLATPASDPDARLVHRGHRNLYGYKAHIAVDRDSRLIRRLDFTPATVNDTVPADALICGDEQAVYADKAYATHRRRAWLNQRGIGDGLMYRADKHHPLSDAQKAVNKALSKVRYQVETTFALWKQHYGYRRVRYYTLERNRAQLYLMAIATNLRRWAVLA